MKIKLFLCISIFVWSSKILAKEPDSMLTSQIRLEVCDGDIPDSVTIRYWDEFFLSGLTKVVPFSQQTISNKKRGCFVFNLITKKRAFYFQIGSGTKENNKILMTFLGSQYFILEPGDSVLIKVNKIGKTFEKTFEKKIVQAGWELDGVTFEGKRTSKFRCKQLISSEYIPYQIHKADDAIASKAALLKKYKDSIATEVYYMMYGDILGDVQSRKHEYIQIYYPIVDSSNYAIIDSIIINYFENNFDNEIPNSFLIRSKDFFESLFKKIVLEYRLYKFKANITFQQFIEKRYLGTMLDKLLTAYFLQYYEFLINGEELLDEALSKMKSEKYKSILAETFDVLRKGKSAFNFNLPDVNGKLIRLSDFQDKVVFIDFWYNGCIGCAQFYIKTLSEVEEEYKCDTSVVFISISIDSDRDVWLTGLGKTFLKDDGTEMPMYTSTRAINIYTEGKGANHPIIKHYRVHAYPRPIVIDKEGKIFEISSSGLRHKDYLIKTLEQAK